jgi:hypothetical protein
MIDQKCDHVVDVRISDQMVIIQRNDCGASCFGQIIEQFRTPLFNIDLTIFVDKRL